MGEKAERISPWGDRTPRAVGDTTAKQNRKQTGNTAGVSRTKRFHKVTFRRTERRSSRRSGHLNLARGSSGNGVEFRRLNGRRRLLVGPSRGCRRGCFYYRVSGHPYLVPSAALLLLRPRLE